MVLYPRRFSSSYSTLWEPEISQIQRWQVWFFCMHKETQWHKFIRRLLPTMGNVLQTEKKFSVVHCIPVQICWSEWWTVLWKTTLIHSDDYIYYVGTLIQEDRCLKFWQNAAELNISAMRVHKLICDHIYGTLFHACYPIQNNQQSVLDRIITSDVTWIHHFTPESKVGSMMCKDTSLPTKNHSSLISEKTVASVLWTAQCILLVDFVPSVH